MRFPVTAISRILGDLSVSFVTFARPEQSSGRGLVPLLAGRVRTSLAGIILAATTVFAGASSDTAFTPRPTLSAGMGVSYMNASDVVEMINGTYISGTKVTEFKAAVDFFGSFCYPLSSSWALKLEYSYLLATYNISSSVGPSEFTTMLHAPNLFVQYFLFTHSMYNIKAGFGLGPHYGTMTAQYGALEDSYSASGPGIALELEGNTSFAEHVMIHLGVNARWEFLGELKNSAGRPPGVNDAGKPVTLNEFGAGARIGFSYVF